jgi:hypothetical protein
MKKTLFNVTKPFEHNGRKWLPGEQIKLSSDESMYIARYGPDKDPVTLTTVLSATLL